MLSSAELDTLEKLSATIGYLPHRKVLLLLASYRELLGRKPTTLDDFIATLPANEQGAITEQAQQLAGAELRRRKTDRRKKGNETLGKETEG